MPRADGRERSRPFCFRTGIADAHVVIYLKKELQAKSVVSVEPDRTAGKDLSGGYIGG